MIYPSPQFVSASRRGGFRRARHRGIAIILVLGLMAITVALTYAMMRSQTMSTLVQSNLNRDCDAQQAAQAGMSIALRKLHDDTWPGFLAGDTATITGTLSSTQSFTATYAIGDPRLTPLSPDYSRYPWRVTISVTGTATVVGNSQPSSHNLCTVVELLPRQLATEPANWSLAQNYTVYQWADGAANQFRVELPSHIDGLVRIRSKLDLCGTDEGANSGLTRYLQDLAAMGAPDYRPFDNNVDLVYAYTDSETRKLLTDKLGVTTKNTSDPAGNSLSDFGFSKQATTYRLFPKGKLYSVGKVSGQLSNVVLAPDVLTNPLGWFVASGSVTVGSNVSFTGTLHSRGDILFSGANTTLQPVSLPAVDVAAAPVQLPVLATEGNVTVQSGSSATVAGLVFVGGRFTVVSAPQDSISFNLAGRLVTKELLIDVRQEWNQSDTWWQIKLLAFQLSGASFFPPWLETNAGLRQQPRVTLLPPSETTSYHWKNGADSVYVPGSADGGLRWNVLDWRDTP